MIAARLIRRVPANLMGIAGLRPSDVWLAAFPKAGSSWFRTMFANIITIQESDGELIDFSHIDHLLPALGYSNLLRPWPYRKMPRLIKTHQPYRPILFSVPRRAIYLSRDPRDVMVSYYHMQKAHRRNRFSGTFSEFVRHPTYGLRLFLRHYASWSGRCTHIIRYEDLRADTMAELRRIFDALGVDLPFQTLEEAVRRTSIDQLREAQAERGLFRNDLFDADYQFVRSARPGEWRQTFAEADIAYYNELCVRYSYPLHS